MKDNILEELKKYDAPKTLPPIADRAFATYMNAGYTLGEAQVEAIEADLAQYAKADDLKPLTDAIVGLGAFALYLRDQRDDAEGSEKVARIIAAHGPKYASIGERIVHALQDLAGKATGWLDQFTATDRSDKTRAPKVDADKPEGTVSLKELRPAQGLEPPRPPVKKPRG